MLELENIVIQMNDKKELIYILFGAFASANISYVSKEE